MHREKRVVVRVGFVGLAALLVVGIVAVEVAKAAGAQAAPAAGAPAGTATLPSAPSAVNAAATGAGAGQTGAPTTIQSRASLVSLDIVVTDASGRTVRGLMPKDFAVFEDGAKMTPRNFEEHRAQHVNPSAAPPAPTAAQPENVFTNFSDVGGNGALNVLLLDLMNTPAPDQVTVRQQMMKYLKNIPAGTQMAVFGLNTQLAMLQGFTSDPEVLKKALEGMATKQSVLLRTAQDDDADNDALSMLNGGGDPSQAAITQALASFQEEGAAMQTVIRIKDTLDALNVLARYLEGLPGRKNLIWFSGSFPVSLDAMFAPGSSQGITKPFGPSVQQDFTGDLSVTSDLLSRARVAVYPIDSRGVFTNPALKVDTSQSSLTNPFKNGMPAAKGNSAAVPQAFTDSEVKMEKSNDEEHASMDEMADLTGGKAQYGTNDLAKAVETAIESGSNYYTLTYVPTNHNLNGSFRSIKVTTDFPGAQLRYRRGYLALAGVGAGNGEAGAPTTMQRALVHGAPSSTQIVFKVKVDEAAETENEVPKGDHPNAREMKPPYRHYTVWYAADLRRVAFAPTPDGKYKGEVVYEARLCDRDGGVVNSVSDILHADLSKDKYVELLKNGLNVRQDIDAPARGEYYLRIAMHDPASDRVGAMEIPLAAVKVGGSRQ